MHQLIILMLSLLLAVTLCEYIGAVGLPSATADIYLFLQLDKSEL